MEEVIHSIKSNNICPDTLDITIKPNDTIVLKFDQDKFDIDTANEMSKIITNAFPKNNFLCLFNGMEIGVIHEE